MKVIPVDFRSTREYSDLERRIEANLPVNVLLQLEPGDAFTSNDVLAEVEKLIADRAYEATNDGERVLVRRK